MEINFRKLASEMDRAEDNGIDLSVIYDTNSTMHSDEKPESSKTTKALILNEKTESVEWHQEEENVGEKMRKGCFKNIKDDIKKVLSHYADDWNIKNSSKTKILSGAAFAFFANVIPAVIFGIQLGQISSGTFGVPAVIAGR